MTNFKNAKKTTIIALCFVLILTVFTGCEKENSAPDYSLQENWAYYAVGEDRPVDLFFISPTIDTGKNGNYNISLDNETSKEHIIGSINLVRGVYEETATIYSPHYRQMTLPVYSMTEEEMQPYFDIAYADVAAAFEYYMSEINNGRPLILAGFSQGSDIMLELMGEYFGDPKYNDLLIAAYCIGWRVTDDDLNEFQHMKTAQGEDDTGVIICFNTEAEGITDSILVPNGVKSHCINPLNWMTDGTPADKSLNLGAVFTDYDGSIKEEIPNMTGAYINEERGTLCVPDVPIEEYSSPMFPAGIFHLCDYQFFYNNLKENVAVRTEAYLSQK